MKISQIKQLLTFILFLWTNSPNKVKSQCDRSDILDNSVHRCPCVQGQVWPAPSPDLRPHFNTFWVESETGPGAGADPPVAALDLSVASACEGEQILHSST